MSEHGAQLHPRTDEGENRPLSVSARLGRLQFHHSGKFRVLQFADIQDGPNVSKDTILLIRAALEAARPDVVIFTGNQIAGYDAAYAATYRKRRWQTPNPRPNSPEAKRRQADLEKTRETVRAQIAKFVQPLIDAGVPWAVTYGNHDFQCGLDNAELDEIYRGFEGCLNGDASLCGDDLMEFEMSKTLPDQYVYACEPGTFALPVSDAEHRHTVIGLVLLDSGDYARAGGYGSPSARGLEFLRKLPAKLGHDVESIVFQHTAMPQYYQLLKPVSPTTAHAIEGYRMFAGQYYALDEDRADPGSYVGEGVSCPDNDAGEFAVLHDTHGYFAVAAGHDHRNAFSGRVEGVKLIETPTAGFESYGPVPAKRAARLFEFDIRHPYDPRTQLLEYGDIVGKPSSKKAYVYGMTAASKSESEGVDLLHRPSWFARVLDRILQR
ncbi:metallophosphoesterase [Bifidobacterium choloepi]|uniref:Serine/threonine protein phosphatase n=1 Tax=Bifidobacterium choloepi TaxID=2614131 RepID=A0A6I5MYU8_9BIFI|nr:metallophosphoesterase [Bifidobacterium choloepi]NEG69808.1 serine/threonine protein phosphatase [Bifidobacterium choloepi]